MRGWVAVNVRYYTDPGCIWSWSAEPAVRRLMTEFGDGLSLTFVMGGLWRETGDVRGYVEEWTQAAAQTGMPNDPGLWLDSPICSSYPGCMAVTAAAEQAGDGGCRYLRALREGLVCLRRKLDTTEALVEEARGAGLDVERFRIDLASNAIVEGFAAQLEETRAAPAPEGCERIPFPTLRFGDDGWVVGPQPYGAYQAAARAAGAAPAGSEPPSVLDALKRFGRMAAPEVEAVCDLPAPHAHAELWGLVADWKAKPLPVLGTYLFEAAY